MDGIADMTSGYSSQGIKTLMLKIKAIVITDASTKMDTERTTLETELDRIWHGHSENIFKQNMADHIRQIRASLQTAYTALENEVNSLRVEMGKVDDNLVKRDASA